MRRWRSFLAITSRTPSSNWRRPIFQIWATLIEYCSMLSGAVVGTIRTAIWLPFLASNALIDCCRALASAADNVPVWSTTRPTSGGTATSAKAGDKTGKIQPSSSASRMVLASLIAVKSCCRLFRRGRRRRIEIDLRRDRDFLLVLDRKIRLFLVAEHHRGQIVREGTDADIIVLHRLDVAVARHGDAVLGAFELRHQITEQRIGFQLRIVLGHDQ